jgi:hypothetical protein
MQNSIDARLDAIPRKAVAAGRDGVLKSLEPAEAGRLLGRLIERAFELGGITAKEISIEFGHAGQAAVSRWMAGTEKPPIMRLLQIARVKRGLLLALAEDAPGVEVQTVLTVRRRA